MELPFNAIAAVIGLVIFLLVVIGFAYLTKEKGESALDRIFDFGCFIEELAGKTCKKGT